MKIDVIGVTGRGEGTSATRGAASSASWTLRALWIAEAELFEASLAVESLSSTDGFGLLLMSEAVRLHPLGSGSDAGGAVLARVEAACAGVLESSVTAEECIGGLATGGLGAGFLASKVGEHDEKDVASGDTGGLPLEFRAIILGECLRFGGIGVPDFWATVRSTAGEGTGGGALFFSFSLVSLLPLRSTNGAILASTAEVDITGVGGAVIDSGVGAGTGVGEGSVGSLAGVDRLQVRVVVSLEGLS